MSRFCGNKLVFGRKVVTEGHINIPGVVVSMFSLKEHLFDWHNGFALVENKSKGKTPLHYGRKIHSHASQACTIKCAHIMIVY